jgi:hypothetical protein
MLKSKSRRRKTPKRVLALPDLEQTKTAVTAHYRAPRVDFVYPGSTQAIDL